MIDIVERLRAITGQAGDHGDVQLCDAAADEIERLRAHVALLEATSAASHSGFMLMAGGFENAVAEVSRLRLAEVSKLRLTDEEREAVEWFAAGDETCYGWGWKSRAATLRGLLERTQTVEK